jgi:hypothetical protein
MDVEAYLANRQAQQAVALALVVVGESIKALPPDLRGVTPASHGRNGPVCATSSSISIFGSISAVSGVSSSAISPRWRLP